LTWKGGPALQIVARDITERKRAEVDLRESESRLNRALEASHTGAWDLDLMDHSAYRTLIHDRIFGYETLLQSWTYEMFLEHVLPEDRPEVDASFREATAAQADWNFECRIRRTDGEVRWIQATGSPERGLEGKPVRMAGLVQDITERKRAEETLKAQAERLERLNEELQRFNRLAVGREKRMIELKQQMNALAAKHGEPSLFPLDFLKDDEARPKE